jgi:hypothetical protein
MRGGNEGGAGSRGVGMRRGNEGGAEIGRGPGGAGMRRGNERGAVIGCGDKRGAASKRRRAADTATSKTRGWAAAQAPTRGVRG